MHEQYRYMRWKSDIFLKSNWLEICSTQKSGPYVKILFSSQSYKSRFFSYSPQFKVLHDTKKMKFDHCVV